MLIEDFEKLVKSHSQKFDKSAIFSMNALVGEVGELANVLKKMEYYKHFPTYNKRVDKEIIEGKRIAHPDQFVDEAGDVLFYLIQLFQRLGLNVEEVMKLQEAKLKQYCKTYNKNFEK